MSFIYFLNLFVDDTNMWEDVIIILKNKYCNKDSNSRLFLKEEKCMINPEVRFIVDKSPRVLSSEFLCYNGSKYSWQQAQIISFNNNNNDNSHTIYILK